MATLSVLTLNVQGLKFPTKSTKAFQLFSSLSAHVVCLQEMHSTTQSSPTFFGHQYPQVYTASAFTKQWGVLIAFHHTTQFTLLAETRDPKGRYLAHWPHTILLTGHILDCKVTIVYYYTPNLQSFLSHLLSAVASHKQGTLLICGDSKQVIYSFLDKYLALFTAHRLSYQQLLN